MLTTNIEIHDCLIISQGGLVKHFEIIENVAAVLMLVETYF